MISQHEFTALSWLHGKLGLDSEDINLYYLIGNLREGKYGLYYNCYEIDGRPIWQPKGELKVVQKAISQKLLPMFPRHRSCFGFSGGNCRQVAEKHLGFKSVLMFDLRYAFSQVSHLQVFNSLWGYPEPRLSFYAARLVADLCTVGKIERVESSKYDSFTSSGGILPQGTATSPRLFDLC
ncbi:MAG: reverse transcriptase domain-containing protein, partial [Patescibacteria group bacterium]